MRIPSGVTDQYVYFVAVDANDLKSREVGLSSFTVYRSRNGGAAAAMTTPTINETDATNMPGVYELLLDEDMTIDSGDDSQEMAFHITHAGMAPVTRVIELYRPKITAGNTLNVAADGDIGGNVDGNVVGSVGSISGVTFPTNFADLSITATTGRIDVGSWLGTAVTTSSTSAKPEVDMYSISDDATAANNAELAFDGTGFGFTNCTIPTVTTLTGHTAQTGDTYALANGAAGFVAIDTVVDSILAAIGSPSDFGSGTSTIAANLQDMADNGTATFDRSTDSLQAIRDRGDAAWITATSVTVSDKTGFSLSAAGVDAIWDEATAGHVTAGTYGVAVTDVLADTSTTLPASLTAIETDTQDIQTQIGTAGAGLTDLGGMSTAMKAEVNAEVDTALITTTYAEPGQGTPGATISIKDKIGYLYKAWRNKSDQSSTTYQLYNDDASTVDQKATVSDATGVATKGEVTTGP